ncbi:MAG: tRNA (adenosine(37)-N6)-dimethylallyltransferase MiaA [Acidimicrobiales bacterium]|nr:tRNA (adenosine(37)-N6)-dimethylallyltransferase MiaA [Acidimicrobiales bacterium]
MSIVGTTASGKSAIALEIAKNIPKVEIVSIDSMQIYRGMNIGTAKPSAAEREMVPHHLIDIIDPNREYSLSQFQTESQKVIADIEKRGGMPLLVGGTGLHLRAVIDNFQIPEQYPEVSRELENESDTKKLYSLLVSVDPIAAERMEETNRRRIVRALEVTLGSGQPFSSYGPGLQSYPPTRFRMYGPRWSREEINHRIDSRFNRQLTDGFLNEVQQLISNGKKLSRTARQALGYRQFLDYLEGKCTLEEAIDIAKRSIKKFARKQDRWFRRDPRIQWFDIDENSLEVVPTLVEEWRQCV